MKTTLEKDHTEISQEIWFDETLQVVIVNVDRISILFSIDEFFDLADRVEVARDTLVSNHNVVIGVYDANGEEKREAVIVSEDDEFH
jgi:hypothetical protein